MSHALYPKLKPLKGTQNKYQEHHTIRQIKKYTPLYNQADASSVLSGEVTTRDGVALVEAILVSIQHKLYKRLRSIEVLIVRSGDVFTLPPWGW